MAVSVDKGKALAANQALGLEFRPESARGRKDRLPQVVLSPYTHASFLTKKKNVKIIFRNEKFLLLCMCVGVACTEIRMVELRDQTQVFT